MDMQTSDDPTVFIHLKGAAGEMWGRHPMSRIQKLVEIHAECERLNRINTDPTLRFYEQPH